MGIVGSKSKQKKDNEKLVKCVGYSKLLESPDSSPEPTSTTGEVIEVKPNAGVDGYAHTSQTETDDMCTGEGLFIGQDPRDKCGPSGHTMSLSLTTQISPKSQMIPVTDGDNVVHETITDTPQLKPKVPRRKEAVTTELAPLSVGKLGDKGKVRKQLEEQGLLSDTNATAKGEGILGELREVGILQQNTLSTDLSYMLSTGEPRRRLPPKLAHLPITEKSLPDRLRELKLSDKIPVDGTKPDVALRTGAKNQTTGVVSDLKCVGNVPEGVRQNKDDEHAEIEVTDQTTSDAMVMKIKLVNLEML